MVAQMVKNPLAMQEMQVWSLGQKDPLEEGMATHSSTVAWESHGQRSLVGYHPWGRKGSDRTERLTHTHTHKHGNKEVSEKWVSGNKCRLQSTGLEFGIHWHIISKIILIIKYSQIKIGLFTEWIWLIDDIDSFKLAVLEFFIRSLRLKFWKSSQGQESHPKGLCVEFALRISVNSSLFEVPKYLEIFAPVRK